MSEVQAGTPAPEPESRASGDPAPSTAGTDGSGLNAQQQKEYPTLKLKAEEFNKVQAERDVLKAQLEAVNAAQVQGQATDTGAWIAELREQAKYDPVARAALIGLEQTAMSRAEMQLSEATSNLPEAKREKVKAIIRGSNYQRGVEDALSLVTDPETKTLAEQLEAANTEITRLKTQKPNAASPTSTIPATVSADESGMKTEMKHSEYTAKLKAASDAPEDSPLRAEALELMKAAAANRLKLVKE